MADAPWYPPFCLHFAQTGQWGQLRTSSPSRPHKGATIKGDTIWKSVLLQYLLVSSSTGLLAAYATSWKMIASQSRGVSEMSDIRPLLNDQDISLLAFPDGTYDVGMRSATGK